MARQKPSVEDTKTDSPELDKVVAMIGLCSRIARDLGVTSSHVLQVAKRKRKSKRITAAITKAVRKIEREERAA